MLSGGRDPKREKRNSNVFCTPKLNGEDEEAVHKNSSGQSYLKVRTREKVFRVLIDGRSKPVKTP